MKSLKLHFAVALYRWNLSSGIISILFSALAFVGIFALAFAAPWYMLLLVVAAIVLGTGFALDRGVKIWEVQALVGTVRNPYLVDLLYQKEALLLKHSILPQMRALRALLNDPRAIVGLDESIHRLEETLRNKKWSVGPDEKVYE